MLGSERGNIYSYLEDQSKLPQGEANRNNLSQPYQQIEYKDADEVNIQNGPFRVSFGYERIDERGEDEALNDVFINLDKLRKVTHYSFSRTDRKQSPIVLNDLLPKGYKVIFKPGENKSCALIAGYNIIMVQGDLATPVTLIDLLHEVGHAWDYEGQPDKVAKRKYSEPYLTLNAGFATKEDMKKVLKMERNAWAFTLKALRPFLDGKNEKEVDYPLKRADIQSCIHDYSLSTYGRLIGEQLFAMDSFADIKGEVDFENDDDEWD